MLVDLVERIGRFRAGRIAVHLRLSALRYSQKREYYVRIATETFTRSLRAFEGQIFPLENGDILFVAKDATVSSLTGPVDRVRSLFSGDPLTQYDDRDGQKGFCAWYNLERDYEAFYAACHAILREAEERRASSEVPLLLDTSKLLKPIRAEQLARLEIALSRTDVSSMVRRQTVCTLIDQKAPQALFEEIFVSIEDLQGTVTPGIDLLANPWLFQYLTHTLDQRVMMMLMRDGVATARPFSLNLNIATILSPEFAKFESIITPQLRGRLVVEMNKLDVFSDMGAFLFARDYLREHGFRLCLDGLTPQTLFYYDRERLGFDLLKIYWTPDSLDDILPELLPSIRNIVMDCGQAHTILCRCDSERALQVGQELGIVMFQGRYVERLLNPLTKP